jgi:hypothetical protein
VSGVALHHALRPALLLLYEFDVLCGHDLVSQDGTPLVMSVNKLRTAVKDAANALGSVTVFLPDESNQQMSFIDYAEGIEQDFMRTWHGVCHAKAVQFRTNVVYGTIERLGGYTIDDLGAASIDSLGVL